ncbi:ROK family protein [Persephonella sp.]
MKSLGIDIGGTFLKYIYKENNQFTTGKIYTRDIISEGNPDLIIKEIKNIVEKFKPESIGIAVAGLVDKKTGRITNSPNIKSLDGYPLKENLEKIINIPVYIENDASLAAYGEYMYGAGKNSKILICLTLGTGLGGGAVINGKILSGVSGSAMEIGHTIIQLNGLPCHCGRKGCLEAYVSSYGLERIYYLLTDKKLSSSEIISLANEGNKLAMESLEKFSEYLAIGLMNITHIFNPDKILIAGGIPEYYPALRDITVANLKKLTFPLPFRDLSIENAALREFSGAYGALAYGEKGGKD